MRLLFFSMHGGDAESMSLICHGAGVDLDVACAGGRFVDAMTTPADLQRLSELGVGAPSDEEICERVGSGLYDGVVLSTPEQVAAYRRSLRTLNNRIPLIIHHTINRFDLFRQQRIQNFLSPSRRALVQMQSPNVLRIRKLAALQWLPNSVEQVADRRGLVSFIHKYKQFWPHEWKKFVELNRLLSPLAVENYGEDSPHGVVNDVDLMRGARATVHLKGGGICCYAIIRSMALGTPVVVDAETVRRCYLDEVEGLLVGRDLRQVADELERLSTDDDYWKSISANVVRCARKQFQFSAELGDRLREFLKRSQERVQAYPRRLATPDRLLTLTGSNRLANRGLSQNRIMRGMLTIHAAIEPRLVVRGSELRDRWVDGCPLDTDTPDSSWNEYEALRAQNRALFENRIERALSGQRTVTFVKIGAHDGATGDPLHEMTMRNSHWRGLLAEPVPHLFQRLEQNYGQTGRFSLANVAVDRRSGSRRFYYVSEEAPRRIDLSHLHDQLGSFNKQHLLRHLGERIRPFIVEQQIRCLRLSDLLQQYHIATYDMIQIDTEGHDFNVLRQIDFRCHRPACILFEHTHLCPRQRRRSLQLLEYQNYRLYDCGNDLLAVSS